jgi:hypothetical protein
MEKSVTPHRAGKKGGGGYEDISGPVFQRETFLNKE